MKSKKVILIPIILIIISIMTSIIAFKQSEKLELGYLFIDNLEETTYYEGEYFSVIGNIDYDAYYISVESLSNYIKIVTYDVDENIQKEFSLVIKRQDETYNKSIVNSIISSDRVVIDDMEDYLFKVNLENNQTYVFEFSRLDNNPDQNEMDIILVNIPESIFNMKSLMESVAFTTLVFAIISSFTIVALYFIKRR